MSAQQHFALPFSDERGAQVIENLIRRVAETDSAQITRLAEAYALASVRPSPVQQQMFDRLMAIDIVRGEGVTEATVFAVRQLQALFSKRERIPGLEVDGRKVAFRAFLRSEDMCRKTNQMLASPSKETSALLFQVSRKIASVLGPFPGFQALSFGFGPGAAVGVSKLTSIRRKLTPQATSTVGAAAVMADLAHQFPLWYGLFKPKATIGGYWTSVPKSFKTERGITVEPLVNSFLQKGLGRYIRDRLVRVGIDTRDQTRNQRAALKGSRDGSLATIDLSMASDTIASRLVLELLPFDWFVALDAVRSHRVELPDGRFYTLEKFSSMGNGFTFELETLIFWAIASVASGNGPVLVYGDDIVCESGKFDDVVSALESLGFVPNKDKSFGTGPFRESCGKDYYGGVEVRPCFLKEDISVKEIFRLYNFFLRSGRLDPSFLLEFVPVHLQTFGPDGFGDGHLVDNDYPFTFDKRGWEGRRYVFQSYTQAAFNVPGDLAGDFGAKLYLCGTESRENTPWRQSAYLSPCDGGGVERTFTAERRMAPKWKKRHFACLSY